MQVLPAQDTQGLSLIFVVTPSKPPCSIVRLPCLCPQNSKLCTEPQWQQLPFNPQQHNSCTGKQSQNSNLANIARICLQAGFENVVLHITCSQSPPGSVRPMWTQARFKICVMHGWGKNLLLQRPKPAPGPVVLSWPSSQPTALIDLP